jgi:hypothetical protein
VATSTLANSRNRHQLFADIVRPLASRIYANRQPQFRVFPTGQAEYHWCIVALAGDRTISRHNSLAFAIKKCKSLNGRRQQGRRR